MYHVRVQYHKYKQRKVLVSWALSQFRTYMDWKSCINVPKQVVGYHLTNPSSLLPMGPVIVHHILAIIHHGGSAISVRTARLLLSQMLCRNTHAVITAVTFSSDTSNHIVRHLQHPSANPKHIPPHCVHLSKLVLCRSPCQPYSFISQILIG